jgi:DNA-binding transcriptional regulator/RsmH inhibitor MraZ
MQSMQMRIYVDFNTTTTDSKERVYINTQMQPALEKALQPGLIVTLYDEEMEVEAIAEFDAHDHVWLGQPNWSTRRDLPLSNGQDTGRVV